MRSTSRNKCSHAGDEEPLTYTSILDGKKLDKYPKLSNKTEVK